MAENGQTLVTRVSCLTLLAPVIHKQKIKKRDNKDALLYFSANPINI